MKSENKTRLRTEPSNPTPSTTNSDFARFLKKEHDIR